MNLLFIFKVYLKFLVVQIVFKNVIERDKYFSWLLEWEGNISKGRVISGCVVFYFCLYCLLILFLSSPQSASKDT